MRIVGFKTNKPKQFKYKPLFYDERKEELERLKKKYEAEGRTEGVSPDFKERLKASWKTQEKRTGNISTTTMIVYFALAAIILYLVFFR